MRCQKICVAEVLFDCVYLSQEVPYVLSIGAKIKDLG